MDKNESKILSLKLKRQRLFGRVQVAYDLIKDLNISAKLCQFRARMDKIESTYEEFQNIQCELSDLVSLPDFQSKNDILEVSRVFDELFFEVTSARDTLEANRNDNHDSSGEEVQRPGRSFLAPEIKIPSFSGHIRDWPPFFNLFRSLVHENTVLTHIEKFHYLLSSLKGTALSLVKTIPLIKENYELAWETLLNQFSESRALFIHYANSILDCNFTSNEEILNQLRENLSGLYELKREKLFEEFICHFVLQKIDLNTRRSFESRIEKDEIPNVEKLINFLAAQNRVNMLSSVKDNRKSKRVLFVKTEYTKKIICTQCKGAHHITKCDIFLGLKVDSRRDFVKKERLCFNCLNPHLIKNCRSKFRCRSCNKSHNTLLHRDERSPSPSNHDSENENSVNCNAAYTLTKRSILPTALAEFLDISGRRKRARILIDSGSEMSFISERLFNALGLKSKKWLGTVTGVNNAIVNNVQGLVTCKIYSIQNQSFVSGQAIVISNITSKVPPVNMQEPFEDFKHLKLADPDFQFPGEIDFLVGTDLISKIWRQGCISSRKCNLLAVNTIFGYVVMGSCVAQKNDETQAFVTSALTAVENNDLNYAVRRFWEVEEISNEIIQNKDDNECEKIFQATVKRDICGRYIVALPFKNKSEVNLGSTYDIALKRLYNLEKRLSLNPTLAEHYRKYMKEFIKQGFMSRVTQSTEIPNTNYIPHHPVVQKISNDIKIRVVFDASCKSDRQISLNDCLYSGPKLQNEIGEILLKFRIYPVVFTTDIQKMFLQIRIREEDTSYQRILWRFSPLEPVGQYTLSTVTFGVTSSPYLAIRTLHQLVNDEGAQFPKASKALLSDTYVDDIVTGDWEPESAFQLQRELKELLAKGGFQLRKWMSNSLPVLKDIPSEHRIHSSGQVVFNDETSGSLKILGLIWDPEKDTFSYSVEEKLTVFSKRAILSCVARIFDPIGLITPVVFKVKCLLQEIWKIKIGWDDSLPENIIILWQNFLNGLPSLRFLQIPRHCNTIKLSNCILVGFSDASELGYAACVYLVTKEAHPKVTLLTSKSKVAPLKTLSIPRLELLGAHLLSKLIKMTKASIETLIPITDIILFSDSTIVLSWIKAPPHTLKTFVANRVIKILDQVEDAKWYHVASKENPADLASRGLYPPQIIDNELWFQGPPWLVQSLQKWPLALPEVLKVEELPEVKSHVSTVHEPHDYFKGLGFFRFSSWTRLVNVVAWSLRFINNARQQSKSGCKRGILTCSEINHATMVLLKCDQQFHFPAEFRKLKGDGVTTVAFQKLNVFIDHENLLRVGGRLCNSRLNYNTKFPIILAKNSEIAELLILYYHNIYLHAGSRTLQFLIQQNYWIISARNKIKNLVSKCVRCARLRCSPSTPLMASLPEARVTPSRVFSRVGVDLAGPYSIKEGKRRGAKTYKAYFAIFVCMSTKAIHLEVLSDLSSEAFIATLNRFVSRRGICQAIYSDCGTNFVGAKRHLIGAQKFLNKCRDDERIMRTCSERGIVWNFNPPSSPHFGGLWEGNIRVVKNHLKRVIGDSSLTYEEFTTILTKIEAILNSRPLCSLSSDPEDIQALTPGHFLIGEPLISIPEYNYSEVKTNRLNRWEHLQKITQHFWQRWNTEYLQALQNRVKWYKATRNLQVNDLVVIKDTRSPPLKWPLGRIREVKPGSDGVVRVASVQTSDGIYIRPVTKLCLLPIE